MGKSEEISVALSDEVLHDVDAAIRSGDYASVGEVVRDALQLWRDRKAGRPPHPMSAGRERKSRDEMNAVVQDIQRRWKKDPFDMEEIDRWLYDENGLPH